MTFRELHNLKMKIRAGKATAAEIARYKQCARVKIPAGVTVKFRAGVPTEKQMRLADRAFANASPSMRGRMQDMTPQAIATLARRGPMRERASRSTTRSTTRRASSASSSRKRPRQSGADDGDPEPDPLTPLQQASAHLAEALGDRPHGTAGARGVPRHPRDPVASEMSRRWAA